MSTLGVMRSEGEVDELVRWSRMKLLILLLFGALARVSWGADSNGVFFDDFETWDSPTGTTGWVDKAGLPSSIADQTAAVLNGKLYSIGGYHNGPNDPQTGNADTNKFLADGMPRSYIINGWNDFFLNQLGSDAFWGQYMRDISQGIGNVVELQKQVLTLMARDEGRVEATVHRGLHDRGRRRRGPGGLDTRDVDHDIALRRTGVCAVRATPPDGHDPRAIRQAGHDGQRRDLDAGTRPALAPAGARAAHHRVVRRR